jgi:hypothetical protein
MGTVRTALLSTCLATSRSVTLSLARGNRIYAAGSAKVRRGVATIRFTLRHRLPARDYLATLVEYENPQTATASTQVIKLGR